MFTNRTCFPNLYSLQPHMPAHKNYRAVLQLNTGPLLYGNPEWLPDPPTCGSSLSSPARVRAPCVPAVHIIPGGRPQPSPPSKSRQKLTSAQEPTDFMLRIKTASSQACTPMNGGVFPKETLQLVGFQGPWMNFREILGGGKVSLVLLWDPRMAAVGLPTSKTCPGREIQSQVESQSQNPRTPLG